MNKYEIVKFEQGDLALDVNVSPAEETVWLSLNEICLLFGRDKSVISRHIKNIFKEGELTEKETVAKNATVQHEGGKLVTRNIDYYNLDVIISVGYRVKSQNGIVFRRWANSVLKEYLLKGYVINEERTLVTNENYVNLIHKVEGVLEKKVDELDNRVTKIEESHVAEREKIFFDGQFFDARVFLKELFIKAEKEIILIDPYADILALDYIKAKSNGVVINLFISSKAKLSKEDVNSFNNQYGGLSVKINDAFHDRFLIIDERFCYSLGASLNYADKKAFAITQIENITFIETLKKRLLA